MGSGGQNLILILPNQKADLSERAKKKGAEKAACREAVVQKGVSEEFVFVSLSPEGLLLNQGRKKYTPPPWRPPFFFFRV